MWGSVLHALGDPTFEKSLLMLKKNIFFSNKGTFPKIWGHPAQTA